MKKITFLITLLIIPIITIGQTFDFNGTDDGFTPAGSCTLTTNPTFLGVDLTGDGTNPAFGTDTAGVDADLNSFAGVTIKNSDPAGPTFMRISYLKAAGGRRYVNLDITAGDTDYKTYWFDLSNADWAGTEDDVKVHFKGAGNTTYTIPIAGVTLEIDKIQFVDELPREEKLVYEFNTGGDDEGFNTILDATTTVTGGSLVVTPDGGAIAKVTNEVNSVNAAANTHVHIIYKNNSATNNQIRFQFRSDGDNYVGFFGANSSINQSMGSFETLDIDLASTRPEWTGTAQDFQVALRNTANAGNVTDANGTLEIDRIVFDNNATLNIEQFNANEISIYPNPAVNFVTVKGLNTLSKVQLFDVLGKVVFEATELLNDQFSVEAFNSGVYLLKLTDENNSTITKRLIIK